MDKTEVFKMILEDLVTSDSEMETSDEEDGILLSVLLNGNLKRNNSNLNDSQTDFHVPKEAYNLIYSRLCETTMERITHLPSKPSVKLQLAIDLEYFLKYMTLEENTLEKLSKCNHVTQKIVATSINRIINFLKRPEFMDRYIKLPDEYTKKQLPVDNKQKLYVPIIFGIIGITSFTLLNDTDVEITLQLIIDHQQNILSMDVIEARCEDDVHEIIMNPLKQELNQDGNYKLYATSEIYTANDLIIPRHQVNPAFVQLNTLMDNTFKLLVQRFERLGSMMVDQSNEINPVDVVATACLLHNLCLLYK